MPRANHSTELWPPGFAAWIKIGACYQKTSRQLAVLLRPLDLSVAQFDALANLFREDGISQNELAGRLLVTKGNVTGLVNRLAERSLVERRAHPSDRRTNLLALTASGRRLAEQALGIQRDLVNRMMSVLAKPEREELRHLLDRVVAQIDQSRG